MNKDIFRIRPDEKSKNVKERILDIAIRLFYSQGIKHTGINQIISESRVAKASFISIFINNTYMVWNDWFSLHSIALDNLSALYERITCQGATYSTLTDIFGKDLDDIFSIGEITENLLFLGSSSGFIFLYEPSGNAGIIIFRSFIYITYFDLHKPEFLPIPGSVYEIPHLFFEDFQIIQYILSDIN